MGLNGDDQPATINLPGLLHSSSSVTNDDPPYLKIDIPSPAPAEQTHADPPLGRVHTTPAGHHAKDSLETQDLPEG